MQHRKTALFFLHFTTSTQVIGKVQSAETALYRIKTALYRDSAPFTALYRVYCTFTKNCTLQVCTLHAARCTLQTAWCPCCQLK